MHAREEHGVWWKLLTRAARGRRWCERNVRMQFFDPHRAPPPREGGGPAGQTDRRSMTIWTRPSRSQFARARCLASRVLGYDVWRGAGMLDVSCCVLASVGWHESWRLCFLSRPKSAHTSVWWLLEFVLIIIYSVRCVLHNELVR